MIENTKDNTIFFDLLIQLFCSLVMSAVHIRDIEFIFRVLRLYRSNHQIIQKNMVAKVCVFINKIKSYLIYFSGSNRIRYKQS